MREEDESRKGGESVSSADKTYVDAMTADISGRIFAYSIGEYKIEGNWESISLQSDQDMSWCEGGESRKRVEGK